MKNKQIISLLLIAAVVVGLCGNTIANASSSVDPDRDPFVSDAQYYSEIAESNKRVSEYIGARNLLFGLLRAATRRVLNVPLAQQPDDITCGPTCVYMALRFIKPNSYPSLTTVIDDCDTQIDGQTYVYKATNTLNDYLGSNDLKYQSTTIYDSTFANDLLYSIDNDRPVLCCTITGELTQYPRSANGRHYVLAVGYYAGFSGSNYIQECYYNDPHYENAYYGQWTIDIPDMKDAIDSNNDFYIRAE